ncbi:MAG: MCE family protein [Phycisphaeraceae bacterium]|nr:MAG: MCE family protein [Phycisphaeraceae bacterium]
MKPAVRDFAIGATALVGLIGLVIILMLFGELDMFTRKAYTIEYKLNTAAGLVRGSAVTLNGVPVGQITDMTPITHPEPGVEVTLSIDDGVRIPRNSRVAIAVGLLGDGALALTSAPADVNGVEPEYLAPGESVYAKASTIFDEFSALMDTRLEELNAAAGSLQELSRTYTDVGRRVGEMLAPRNAGDVDARGEEPNIATIIARLDRALAETNKWVGDDAMRNDTRDLIARTRTLLDETGEAMAAFRAASETIDGQAGALGSRVEEVTADVLIATESLSAALQDVRIITGRLVEGEGAAGQFLVNPDLYRSLNDVAVRLEKVMTEGQLLIQKWKAEGLPVRF